MRVVALTGGIGAGKSTVGAHLQRLGAYRIDADELARQAVAPGSRGLDRVVAEFGPQVTTSAGQLDRAALAQRVFASEEARSKLEGIVHPEVQRLLLEHLARIEQQDPHAVVVYEIPLLAETAAKHGGELPADVPWSTIVTVEAAPHVRVHRLMKLRGLTEEDAHGRIAAQASEHERRALAHYVIDSGGTEQQTLQQATELWRVLRKPSD